jgi:GNAT superfamily N-acetyltransferase
VGAHDAGPGQAEARAKDGRLILVAVNEVDEPIAYGDLELNGHIDHLYCRPEVIGTGIASALYDQLEQQARERGMTRLFAEASEAQAFPQQGFCPGETSRFSSARREHSQLPDGEVAARARVVSALFHTTRKSKLT